MNNPIPNSATTPEPLPDLRCATWSLVAVVLAAVSIAYWVINRVL